MPDLARQRAGLRRLRLVGTLVLTTLACVISATFAQPAAALQKAIWGPVQVGGVSQFPIYQDLGVDLFQYTVPWDGVAPTQPANPTDPNDPAYRWPAELDQAVAEATPRGIRVLAMVMRTPAWANGGQPEVAPPTDPQQYAMFLEALAKRYPAIRHFMIWGEPIRNTNYLVNGGAAPNYYIKGQKKPTALPKVSPLQRSQAAGYARLVDASYGRLKALNRANLIIGGNTTTSGDIDPFNWFKYLRLPNGKPPRMDLFGHNPFGTRGPDLKKEQILIGTADMSDLDVFIPWVKKYLSRSGRNPRIRLFISEYTAPTDIAGFEFPYHVTRPLQAKWLTAAMNIGKRSKDIYGLGWIGLYDTVRADGQESRTGLIDAKGVRKPAYYAFRRS